MALTITVDVEDHRPNESAEVRFDRSAIEIADWLTARGWTGTFFVVGTVAERWPHVVAEIAARGHEIGLHGWEHRPLVELGADRLLEHGRRGRDVLGAQAGTEIRGFRAPQFSLVADTPWAPQALAEAGFTYSSSIVPVANPLHGFAGNPKTPFRWPSGVVEVPATIVGRGRVQLPFGGAYFRVVPKSVIRRSLVKMGEAPTSVYLHPYDVDPGEKYWVVRDANPLLSPVQWINRSRTFDRLLTFVAAADPAGVAGPSMGAVVDGLDLGAQ